MTVTAKDLRFNVSFLFDVLSKGEDVTITHRGKAKAKLISYDDSEQTPKDDSMFGMWSDRDKNVDTMVRNMRKPRSLSDSNHPTISVQTVKYRFLNTIPKRFLYGKRVP